MTLCATDILPEIPHSIEIQDLLGEIYLIYNIGEEFLRRQWVEHPFKHIQTKILKYIIYALYTYN